MSYRELLSIPIYTFWALAQNTDRLRAEEDLRQLSVVCSILDSKELFAKLQKERGEVVQVDNWNQGFDRRGFDNLKSLIKGG